MKNLIVLLAICLSFTGLSQTQINVNGTITTFSQYRGATGPDLFMRVPKRVLDVIFHNIDSVGNLQMNPADSTLQVYTGRAFEQVLTLPDANAMFAPASAAANYNAGTGLVRTGSSPNFTFAIDPNTTMTVPRAADSINSLKAMINARITLAQARAGLSLTTTGSGAATYNSTTGVFNIPTPTNYTAGTGITISGNVISRSKRQEVVTGTTNASGLVTITYGTAYSSTPNVQPSIVSTNPRESWMLESSSTTGCTVRVVLRTDVVGLLPSYSNVSGRTVSILVTEP